MTTEGSADADEQHRELIAGPGDVEWKWEMRYQCQQIIPGLFLGPFQVSKSKEAMMDLGITHVVCIRDKREAFSVRARFPEQFAYLVLDVEDSEEQNLIKLFPSAKQFINSAIAAGGRVLVHCNGGISLSPAFVVMFVMEHHNLSFEDAINVVQNRRYCISPNGGFVLQIKEYESIYRASAAMNSLPQGMRLQTVRRKRDDDDDLDDQQRKIDSQKRKTSDEGDEPISATNDEDAVMAD